MAAVKKKIQANLTSRDPLKNLSNRVRKKIKLCNLEIVLTEGKKKKRKNIGNIYFSVRRNEFDSYWDDGMIIEYDFDLILKSEKNGRDRDIGSFHVRLMDDRACITYSDLDAEYRGFGIGKKAYQTLAGFFRVLESDPNGRTSRQAKTVWNSMKATKVGPRKSRFRVISNRRVQVE